MGAKSIPVMIDDRKDVGDFRMSRATYFYVEAVEPSADIFIDHGNIGIKVLPLEFSGVIHKPLKRGIYFKTPEQIEEFFQAVESNPSLYVDSDNIWIPNNIFNKDPERGDIYRVPTDLFVKLYSFCRDDATLHAGISRFNDKNNLILFSKVETIAFADWTKRILEDVKASYPKNENLKLEWRE